jgi:SsrA-binding protein
MPKKDCDNPLIATNRKARHDYNIIETFECGISLAGTEVKSCRERTVQITEGFARIENGEIKLYNVHIASYGFGNRFNHNENRTRKLLMHKREILKIAHNLKTKGGTLIPLKFYLKHGLIKVEIGYCQGKTHGDKREDLKRRDDERMIARSLRR